MALSPILFNVAIYAWSEPLFILLTVLFLLILNAYLKKKSTGLLLLLSSVATLACLTRYMGVALILTGAAAILSFQRSATRTKLLHLLLLGIGYNSVSWRTSENIRYLQNQLLRQRENVYIYSNDPEEIYICANRSAKGSPAARGYNSSGPERPVEAIAGAWPESPTAFLVWFDSTDRPHLYEVDQLKQVADIATLARFEDGTIYTVSAK